MNLKITYPLESEFKITQDFFGSMPNWYKVHQAIDLKVKCPKYPNGIGNPVLSCFTGKYIKSGFDKQGGNYIWIRHNSGLEARYYHLDKINHKAGWSIRYIGNCIGWSGNTGEWTTAPHLHLAFIKNGVYLDPEPYFNNYLI